LVNYDEAEFVIQEQLIVNERTEIMEGKFLCVMAQYDRETEQKLKEIQNLSKNII